MNQLSKSVVAGVIAFAATGTANAQVGYTTQGRFTSETALCNQLVTATSATCTFGGFTLTFTGTSAANVGSGSIVSLGTFALTGVGNITVPPPAINFELYIAQTTPSIGNGSFTGVVAGTIVTSASGDVSTLMWNPANTVTIDPTLFSIINDASGPAAGVGLGIPVNNSRGINAIVTSASVVPEPASLALFGTGFIVLAGIMRRKRNA